MAIKNSDPRKLHDLDTGSDRFGQVVADAWATRHEDEEIGDGSTPPNDGTDLRAGTRPGRHDDHLTHQPFAHLKGYLQRH